MCLESGSKEIISGVVLAFSCLFSLMVSWDDASHAQGGPSILSKSLLRKSSQTPRFVSQVSLCPFKLAVRIKHHKASVQCVAEESRKTCPLWVAPNPDAESRTELKGESEVITAFIVLFFLPGDAMQPDASSCCCIDLPIMVGVSRTVISYKASPP